MKRPFVLFAIFLTIGVFTAGATRSSAFIFYLAITIYAIIVIYMLITGQYDFSKIITLSLIPVFFFCGGFILLKNEKKAVREFSEYHDTIIETEGIVSSVVIIEDDRIKFDYTCEYVNGVRKRGKVDVYIYGGYDEDFLKYNDRIVLKGSFSFPDRKKNPGGMDYRRFVLSEGKHGSLYVYNSNYENLGESGYHNYIMAAGNRIRKAIFKVVTDNMDKEPASIMAALLTGIKNGIEKDTRSSFTDSGLIHITAVSGLHIGIIVSFLLAIIEFTGIHRKAGSIIILIVLGFYCTITGFANSVIRAVIMTSTAMAGQIFNRDNDSQTILCAAYSIMLLNNPHRLYNAGFILSFTAALSIILFAKNITMEIKSRLKTKNKVVGYLIPVAGVSAAAQIGTLPFLLLYFNRISVISIIANLFAAPLAGPAIAAGFCFVLAAYAFPATAHFAANIAEIPVVILTAVSGFFSGLPFSSVRTGISSYVFIPVYYAIVSYILFLRNRIKIDIKHLSTVLIFILILRIGIYALPDGLEVVFLDVGAGDSIYIGTPGGKTVLIDGGGLKPPGLEDEDTGEKVLLPFLFTKGVRKIDYVMVSHGHSDHMNGILTVLEYLKVGALLLPDYTESDEFERLIELAGRKSVPVYRLNDTSKIRIERDIDINLLNPPAELIYSTLNNSSLVVELTYKDVGFLFTGDAEYEAERYIMGNNVLEAVPVRIMKAGHHGSVTSTSKEFLSFTDPSIVIVSTGRNKHGHPDPNVLERLYDHGCRVYRTDLNGAVSFSTNGKNLQVKVMID